MQTLQNHSTIVKWCLVLHYFTKTCLVKKGRSHLLLRKCFIKREKELRAEQKEKDLQLLNSIPSLTEQIEDLKKELQEKEKKLEKYMEDSDILRKLYQDGHIDEHGNPIER